MSAASRGVTRRKILAASALAGLAAPALAQGVSGEVAFATNEWTLPHTGRVLRRITENFNKKYPNVRIREVAIPFAGFHDQMLTQLTAGTPPDIFRIDDPQLSLYMERGFLTPLDDALKDAGVDPAGFVPAGQDARQGGKVMAIVYQTNARALFYNQEVMADAGGRESVAGGGSELELRILKSALRNFAECGYTAASVRSIAADNCVLALWRKSNNPHHALQVMTAWGFEFRAEIIWDKGRIGPGRWFRNKHEALWIGVRGNVPAPAPGTQWESIIEALRSALAEVDFAAIFEVEVVFE